MPNKSHYLKYAFSVGTFIFLINMLLGDFYPFLKSFYFKDGKPSEAFNIAVSQIDWVRAVTRPFFISSFMAIFKYYADKRNFKKQSTNA